MLAKLSNLFDRSQREELRVWLTHRAWAVNRPVGGFDCLIQARLNPVVHHCRIGKITLKTAG